MSVEKKVPKIRFKRFSGEWVDSVLKSFSDSFSYGLNASAVKFDGVNKYLRITDIDEKSGRFDYCQLTSPDTDLSKYDDYLLKNGDVLFARTGASVGKTYIYNEQDGKVYFAGFLIRASINHKASAQFIFQNTQTNEYSKFVATTSQRSGQPGINAKEYGEYRLFSPTKPEQTQIGSYFQKLDTLINQHQQKHDKLSSIKKSMLGKMFPKQGESTPEIRFKGFSGEWENLTIGDCSSLITKGTTPMTIGKSFVDRGVTFVKVECVDEIGNLNPAKFAYIDAETDQVLARSRIKESDLLVSIAGALGRAAIVKKEILPANTNQALAIVRLKNDSPIGVNFLYHFTKTRDFKEFVDETASQGAQPNLSLGDISKLRILAPKKEEQTAIGNYFHKLDALVNQHQQQITKLNNIKQACLSKMFV
ncbi:restriction endonuclease subunit S [Serratia marcescens]|uniref:restriction endonuclease subunit S n=1 Tax=Serratia marcescens TaxID=615 RepID=UPI001376D149|nr:restriction endonuclease subunit S [Serratia marcescens]MBH3208870.1 restriction endonuclease subunit S [Serratia marcescens]NCI52830.1 restriction endonuclease subunit S [Serratia marcescens]NDJ07481.1 restriction endonuclease subunit S [Serratia marcescens]NDJ28446.1 restriction endonuclease subunit S [Serratia marcescens]NDJ44012.1 restriction endonuclease subunit S [Serratia marcescens]